MATLNHGTPSFCTKTSAFTKTKQFTQKSFRQSTSLSGKQNSQVSGMEKSQEETIFVRDFYNSFKNLSPNLEGIHLHAIMNRPGESGFAGVVKNKLIQFHVM